MKKMFNLAVAVAAMSSALSLTSCDKLFGNSGNDQTDEGAEIVEGVIEGFLEGALSKDSLAADTTGAAAATPAPEANTPNSDKAPAPEADKAPADKK